MQVSFLPQNVPSTLALRLWSHSLRPVSHYFHHQQKETKITESIAFSISTTVTQNEQQTRNSVTFGVTSVVFSAQGAARHEGNNRRRFGQVASIKRGLSPRPKVREIHPRPHHVRFGLRVLVLQLWCYIACALSPARGLHSNEFLVRTLEQIPVLSKR